MWYARYRRLVHYFRAYNRHGTHSPFAYAFVEQVLNITASSPQPELEADWTPNPTEKNLLRRLAAFYKMPLRIRALGNTFVATPQIYVLLPGASFRRPLDGDIVVVPHIFDSQASYMWWKQLCTDPQIPMSIETDVMGLLFFRKEFLRKQHFRLKRG